MIKRFTELVKQSPTATEKFISHCIDVYEILKKENEPEEVCNAGLYHSIYGTCYLNVTVQTIENHRDLIRSEIGEYAEKLVYEMCSLNNREVDITNGNFNWDKQTLVDIVKICRANLISLELTKNSNYYIYLYNIMLELLNRGINLFTKSSVENDIKIMDNIFPHYFHKSLFNITLNSEYNPNHFSSGISKERNFTTRFSCRLSKTNFFNMGLFPYIKKIANEIGQDLFLHNYYIGHYDKSTSSSSHVDAYDPNCISILIYPNIEWDDLWAGDIKFYNENEDSQFHTVVDFKPGRVVVFDSNIRHKVMPLSSLAETDRFSIAIKARIFWGLANYYREDFENIIHVPCT
jgi:hypothetical protein